MPIFESCHFGLRVRAAMADLGEIIVVDTDNHRVMAWRGCEGRVVAGGTEGSERGIYTFVFR